MALKTFNPYTASRRFITMLDKSEITKETPEKALVEPKKRTGGRNAHGEITIWHRGGGHKKQYRSIDFRREKTGIPARVAAIEYDPNRSARLALLHYADGEKRYILHPIGLEVGMTVSTGEGADILPGNAMAIRSIPPGTQLHNLELQPGKGAQLVRAAGGSAQLLSKDDRPGRKPGPRKRDVRQGWPHPLAWAQADGTWRSHESGRSPARRRRRAREGQPSANAVGILDVGREDAPEPALGPPDCAAQEAVTVANYTGLY
jgi:hypothetical protein